MFTFSNLCDHWPLTFDHDILTWFVCFEGWFSPSQWQSNHYFHMWPNEIFTLFMAPTTLRLADQADENPIWYHFVWRKHENVIPCTGIRVNTNYERIASWGGCQCWTGDIRTLETPLVVASVFITRPWYLIPDSKEGTFSNHDLIVINQLPDNKFDFPNVAYPIHLRNQIKSNQNLIVASLS